MKSKLIIIFVLYFCCQWSWSQALTNRTLHGQVVNDSIKVESGIVFNINSKSGTVINSQGMFSILARVNDTLVFSVLGFKAKKIVLKQNELNRPILRVKIDAITTQLMEVVVFAKKGVQPNLGNSQAIVDTKFFDDSQSSPKNTTMPSNQTIEYGMDFVRIYKDVFKLLKKKNPEQTDFISDKSFTEVAMKSISYSFFTNTLKLTDDEIGLFLIFCENDPKAKKLLNPEDKFHLMDFLITKNEEFKRIVTFEK